MCIKEGGNAGEQKKGGKENTRDKTREKQVRKGVKDKRENRKLRKEKGIIKEKQRVMVGMDQ